MKNWVSGVLLVALGFVARPGQAKVEFEVGARLGYAAPTGKLNDEPPTTDAMQTAVWDNELKSVVLGQVPLGLELGIRALPMLTLGGYVELAPGILGSTASDGCDAYDHDCSTLGIRFGFMGHVHVLPHQPIDPWLGVGVGFEALTLKEELTSRIAITLAYTGVEVPLRAGTLLNVNVPAGEPAGVEVTRLGKRIYRDELVLEDDEDGRRRSYRIYGDDPSFEDEDGTDLAAIAGGRIAVTPLHFDLTDREGMDALRLYDLARLLAPAAREVE